MFFLFYFITYMQCKVTLSLLQNKCAESYQNLYFTIVMSIGVAALGRTVLATCQSRVLAKGANVAVDAAIGIRAASGTVMSARCVQTGGSNKGDKTMSFNLKNVT